MREVALGLIAAVMLVVAVGLVWVRVRDHYSRPENYPRNPDFPRINNGTDAIARGQRWEAFYAEDGGLADMIAKLRRSYFEKVGSLKPGDHEALLALGVADRIAREIEREVLSVIETGRLRAADAEHAQRIAAIRR